MTDFRYSKRQVAARQKQQIEEETKKLHELVADLPFHRIIKEMWERQQRKVRSKRYRKDKHKS